MTALTALEGGFPEQDRFSRRAWSRLIRGNAAILVLPVEPLPPAGPGRNGRDTNELRDDGRLEQPSRLAGAIAILYRRGARVARIYSLAVAPDMKGRGLGAALLRAGEHDASVHGCDQMRLEVRTSNATAIALYERGGYQVIDIRRNYYPDGEDAIRMEKRLPADGSIR